MAAVANEHAHSEYSYQRTHPHTALPPYSKVSASTRAPPPYFAGTFAGIEIASLPPLPETPSEIDTEQQLLYSAGYHTDDSNPYWDGQEVFSYYSPDQTEGAVLYFSGDEEEYHRRCSPGEQQYIRHQHPLNQNITPRNSMGSASSALNEGQTGQRGKKNRRNSSGSDNGGFESTAPKTSLGVKEKLRSSLDKISLKPFRWSSSDKLTHGAGSSKSKSKNNRRYSDSGAAFAVNSPANVLNGQKGNRSGSATCEGDTGKPKEATKKGFWKSNGANRLIKPLYLSEPTRNTHVDTMQPKQLTDTHDYVNLSATSAKVVQNRRRQRPSNDYQLPPTTQNSYYDLTRATDVKETAARAKGTWNMLKTAKTKHAPVKASGFHSSYASLGSSDTLQSSGTSQCPNNTSDTWTTPEVIGDAIEVNEPPKLAPVSGKLLLDKVPAGTTILRPTAFKPPLKQRAVRDSLSPAHCHSSWEPNEHSPQGSYGANVLEEKRSVSCESTHSDSGRHSVTSIPVVNTTGGSFSCSGSEGYASARVSSSTTHSAMHETDLNASDVSLQMSPKTMCDDVMLRDLECRVKAKESELEMLRRSFEDNEKALHMVYDDRQHMSRDEEIFEIKQKYSNDLRSQTAKVLKQQQKLERNFQLAKDENKQLLLTNVELEDRIKTMSDVIEKQSRQQDVAAELRARIDENESQIQHKNGEVAHLKRQLKEKQIELTQRTGEAVALRTRNRELCALLKRRDVEAAQLSAKLQESDHVVSELERRLDDPLAPSGDDRNYLAPLKRDIDTDDLLRRVEEMERRSAAQAEQFEKERQQWAQEKSRVIRYQKQLQLNYVQMYKRSQALEDEIDLLTSQLNGDGANAESDVNSSSLPGDLCYPMEI
uniref:Uncharacterized protein LOC100178688 n=1 Tax=Phallusia mammillata TaxID=59560 RepID=A0A6F9DGX6_9ASCI|nr:uncharacterized protein LOC100178688 [Phallusia mammillata]